MAIALVAHALAGSVDGSSAAVTSAIDTSGAVLLTLMLADASGTASVISDSKGNTWTARTRWTNGGGFAGGLYDCVPSSVGSGHTFSGLGSFTSIAVAAWSGAHATPFDQQSGANSATQPGSLTPSANNALVIQGIADFDASPTLPGYTVLDSNAVTGGAHYGVALAYVIQTTATATNPTWSAPSFTPTPAAAVYLASAGSAAKAMPVFGRIYRPQLIRRKRVIL